MHYDWSILTVYVKPYVKLSLSRAQSQTNMASGMWNPLYTASPLPSRSFSLACFFAARPVARLHWPRACHRLHFCWGRASVALPRLSNSSFLLATTLSDGTNALILNFFPTIYMHCLFICLVVFVGGRTRTTWICLKSWSAIPPNAPRVANQPRNDALDVKLNGIVKGNKFSLLTTTLSKTRRNCPLNEEFQFILGSALTTRIAHFGKESLASRKGEQVFQGLLGR